jgi:uncharacterized protein YbbC (DUF1343 family)
MFRPVTVALHLISVTRRMSGEAWEWNAHFERLAGSGWVRTAIETGTSAEAITAAWAESVSSFVHQREKYLLY